MCQQCVLYPELYHKKCVQQVEGGVLPLQSAMVGPHLQSYIQFWGTSSRKTWTLKRIMRRALIMVRGL